MGASLCLLIKHYIVHDSEYARIWKYHRKTVHLGQPTVRHDAWLTLVGINLTQPLLTCLGSDVP